MGSTGDFEWRGKKHGPFVYHSSPLRGRQFLVTIYESGQVLSWNMVFIESAVGVGAGMHFPERIDVNVGINLGGLQPLMT